METGQEEIKIVDKDSYNQMKQQLDKDNRIKFLIEQLTNNDTQYLLGNTRFFQYRELDIVSLNKEIGEKIYFNMIDYYKQECNYDKDKLKQVQKPILLRLVDKNLLARWSLKSLSKEELITLGIGSFREDTREQMSTNLLQRLPLVGRLFK